MIETQLMMRDPGQCHTVPALIDRPTDRQTLTDTKAAGTPALTRSVLRAEVLLVVASETADASREAAVMSAAPTARVRQGEEARHVTGQTLVTACALGSQLTISNEVVKIESMNCSLFMTKRRGKLQNQAQINVNPRNSDT